MSKYLSDCRFASLNLAAQLAANIDALGFQFCTPIQAQTLPISLAGRDVAGQAQTGTGKSAAFLIAIIQRILTLDMQDKPKPQALVIAPTRELAIQIHHDAEGLIQNLPISMAVAYGGANYEQQRRDIGSGVDILIGTPGRLIDYLKQKVYSLEHTHTVVLDEADRMFDLGFISDMRFILRRCPPPDKRLTLLFSATLSHRVQELAYEHMNNPELVKIVSENVTAEGIAQSLYQPANSEKIPLLIGLMRQLAPPCSMVFTNTKRNAEQVCAYLLGNDIACAMISGDVPQKKRSRMLAEFASGQYKVLVATDVAARGLHIDGVTHVFNFDLPQSGEDYVHRIGRTARAGSHGCAISFACEDTAFNLIDIEEYIHSQIPRASISDALLAKVKAPQKIARKSSARSRQAPVKSAKAPRGNIGKELKRAEGKAPRQDQSAPQKRRHPRYINALSFQLPTID